MRDVIVVGAGGGGPVVAKELAARGLDVLLLEGGPHHTDPRASWTHYENDANNPLTGFLRFGPADRRKPAWLREEPQNSFILQVAGVGGTTQHYYGNSPRAYRGAFAGYEGPDRDAYDTAHAFPFPYAELVPYYEWVEATLPVQTAAMGTKETVFFRGAEKLGIPVQTTKDTLRASYRPQENAILQPGGTAGRTTDPARLVYPRATGCTYCGFCLQGCMEPVRAPRNQFAKRSTDNSYVPMALTASAWARGGRDVTLVPDAFVVRVHTRRRGGHTEAAGVTWRVGATGERHREEARVVVLAGGATETPRLWLNSDLPNPNGWVGRGYTDHFLDGVTGLFDEDTGSSKGPSSAARCDFPGRGALEQLGLGPANQAFVMALSGSGIRGRYGNGRGMTGPWDGRAGRVLGPELKEALLHGVNRLVNILVLTDDDVERDNRVLLSAFPADEHGAAPKVALDGRARSRRTNANREFLARRAAELLRKAGARRVYRFDWAPLLLHVHSSMRMGLSERDSVLTSDAESRWVRRLYVADNSALANALGGPNPTLTTQALATRTAERIFTRHFGGRPWVRAEAPVPSTDPRISAAL
ncbi:GMC family oxidoreductase N-terminal domain-containing protein [Actinomadura kijaniata]|uniref:GMC family oxidoreductase N-terminal domain-containing protein n=1 Tax=Actinomadura kijaniata TaxID=46161 RepID=UPI0008357771|nr:GMC family oxidoreductase N-terminal domain-containing protein [Actinomadura kijaniata]